MKRFTVLLVGIFFIMGTMVQAGEISFEDFKALVTRNVVPSGFTLNTSRTSGSKFSFRVEWKGNEEKMEMISISLFPGVDKFSEMSLKAGNPESYQYKNRPALYMDGEKAGMAGYNLILKGKKGKLSIHHRVFGGTFLKKADFEKMLEKIGLEKLEK